MSKTAVRWARLLPVFFDFFLMIAGLWLGLLLWQPHLLAQAGTLPVIVLPLAIMLLLINAWLGLYQKVHNRSLADTLARAMLTLVTCIPLSWLLFSLQGIPSPERWLLLAICLGASLSMLINRVYLGHQQTVWPQSRVLIFGTGQDAQMIAHSLHQYDPGAELIGFYSSTDDESPSVPQARILSHETSLSETVDTLNIDEIIVAVSERRGGRMPLRELLDCRLTGVQIMDLTMYFESRRNQIRLDSLRAGWLIFGDGFRQDFLRTFNKRLIDLFGSLLLLFLASPLMLLATLLIILEDGLPVFYRQERVGLHGRTFNVIKFRSMRRDAEKDGKPRWASANDDRVTRVGRFIRKFRIDELPQLFCVLRGDMSLIGPRPERPYFVDKLTQEIPFYAVRHSVKPGVTGWAQVRYAYGASVDDAVEKLQYDLYYVKNHNLILDFVVLFETVSVVLSGKGAQ